MSKKIMLAVSIILIIMMICLGILSGCKEEVQVADLEETQKESQESLEQDIESEETEPEEEVVEEVEGPEEEPIEVTDGEGSQITLEKAAESVIVMAPSVLEIIDGLGAMEKLK